MGVKGDECERKRQGGEMTVQSRLQTRVLKRCPAVCPKPAQGSPYIHPTPALPSSSPPLSPLAVYLPACPHLSQLPHLTLHHSLSKHFTSVSLLSTCLYIVSHIGKRFSICPCPHLSVFTFPLPIIHPSPAGHPSGPSLPLPFTPDLFPSVSTLLSVSWVLLVLCLIKPRT